MVSMVARVALDVFPGKFTMGRCIQKVVLLGGNRVMAFIQKDNVSEGSLMPVYQHDKKIIAAELTNFKRNQSVRTSNLLSALP